MPQSLFLEILISVLFFNSSNVVIPSSASKNFFSSGTGLFVYFTTSTLCFLIALIHAENSFTFGIVAERHKNLTCFFEKENIGYAVLSGGDPGTETVFLIGGLNESLIDDIKSDDVISEIDNYKVFKHEDLDKLREYEAKYLKNN